jgi:hypothetical protein
MSKKSSRKSEGDNDKADNEKDKNRALIITTSITALATIIVALISLRGTLTAAVITAGKGKENLPPTTIPVSTSVENIVDTSSVAKCVYPPRYGFECGQAGWVRTSYFQNQAIQTVTTTQFEDRDGASTQVLALTLDFTGPVATRKTENRESGEVLVDLNAFPPAGYGTKTIDLNGVKVVAWIWAPEGSTGDSSHKNGIQLFVKDGNDRNCYGPWQPIDQEKVWFQVHWQESNAAYCELGFNSSMPKLLGVKIAVGSNSIWTTSNPLIFYVDDVDW